MYCRLAEAGIIPDGRGSLTQSPCHLSVLVDLIAVETMLCAFHSARVDRPPIPLHVVSWCTDACPSLVLNDFEPSVSIHLSYPLKHKFVRLGNSIKPKHVGSQPDFEICDSEPMPSRTLKSNGTYVLALTDPDATSRSDPSKAQMCHWIVTNITVPSSAPVTLDSPGLRRAGPKDLIEYLPPTPPPKTGYHRYVFVVLTSESDKEVKQKKPKDRPHWGYGRIGAGVREWAEENGLVVVGGWTIKVA